MRTKGVILKKYSKDLSEVRISTDINRVQSQALIELVIDIRDILDNRLLEIDRDIDKVLTALKEFK